MSQTIDIRELNERIESKSSFVNMITMGMDKVIAGQKLGFCVNQIKV